MRARWMLAWAIAAAGFGCGRENGADVSAGGASGAAGAGASGAAGADDAGASGGASGEPRRYGEVYTGGEFHLGPVDWQESQWHNACAPAGGYAQAIRDAEGELLAGLWNGIENVAGLCDACIAVETAMGKRATLRVVTYGDTTPNSIDVSPEAYALLDSGEYPRTMSWQLVDCPPSGPIHYEFQSGSSEWWTSLWVRNARAPLASVEVKSANHADFVALERGGDGTLTDPSGFGAGPFTLRLTALDGRQIEEAFEWPSGGIAGLQLTGREQL